MLYYIIPELNDKNQPRMKSAVKISTCVGKNLPASVEWFRGFVQRGAV